MKKFSNACSTSISYGRPKNRAFCDLIESPALTLDEINHVAAIADALAFTIEQMGKIDAAYSAAFPDKE